jgi:hypothetical protein
MISSLLSIDAFNPRAYENYTSNIDKHYFEYNRRNDLANVNYSVTVDQRITQNSFTIINSIYY